MASPCRIPLSGLKYFEVFPPVMTHDSWLFSSTFISSITSVPQPTISSLAIKNSD